jgi:hypothetical protein|eukprot:COSAG01_NODE_2939_length_6824_cov_6.394349_7_plen_62_part_00
MWTLLLTQLPVVSRHMQVLVSATLAQLKCNSARLRKARELVEAGLCLCAATAGQEFGGAHW